MLTATVPAAIAKASTARTMSFFMGKPLSGLQLSRKEFNAEHSRQGVT
jgi:hypothetical protein